MAKSITPIFILTLILVGLISCKGKISKKEQLVSDSSILEICSKEFEKFNFNFHPILTYDINKDNELIEKIEDSLNRLLPYLRKRRIENDGNLADIYFSLNMAKGLFVVEKASIYRLNTNKKENNSKASLIGNSNLSSSSSTEVRENVTDTKSLALFIRRSSEMSSDGSANITIMYSKVQ